jgi:subtilase family serine protease
MPKSIPYRPKENIRMRTTRLLATAGTTALAIAGLAAAGLLPAGPAGAQQEHTTAHHIKACSAPAAGHAACFAVLDVPASTAKPAAAAPTGYGPADIQSAYKLAGLSSGGRTVAIVDAYGYASAEADLAVYRSNYGLPACTTANGCFKKIDQDGGTNYPRKNAGWDHEQALDLDAVSAACPSCKILLVQAKTSSFANLGAAVDTAAAQPGVVAISNSYGGGDAADSTYGHYYNHAGIAVTASTGDSGFTGSSYPSSSSYVVGVGGTTLNKSSNARGWTESAWSGTGSGCSTLNSAITAASSFNTGCANRATSDVSAVADPATGLSIYTSVSYQGYSGWVTYGGTSLSSPLIASMYALSGNTTDANSQPYNNASQFFDVTSGSTGNCTPSQWCNARTGWDGPTGVGTPNGVAGL